eukprot:gene5974-6578_t
MNNKKRKIIKSVCLQSELKQEHQQHQYQQQEKKKKKRGHSSTNTDPPQLERNIEQEEGNSNHSTSSKIEFYEPTKPNGFLSNYYCGQEAYSHHQFQLTIEDRSWKTVEHYFQAQKFIYEGCSEKSLEYANVIANASTPNIARELASQKIKGGYPWRTRLNPIIEEYHKTHGVHLRPDWEDVKDKVMYEAVYQKFLQNTWLRDLLIDTKEKMLTEHTLRDKYWGDGGNGTGKKNLGEILMQVRSILRS